MLILLMAWYHYPLSTWLADAGPTGVHGGGIFGQHGACIVDHRAQRQISRLPVPHPLYRAVWPLCLTRRVQLKRYPQRVAVSLFP